MKTAGHRLRSAFVHDCWRRAEAATDRWIETLERRNYFVEDSAYRAMWDRFNREGDFRLT